MTFGKTDITAKVPPKQKDGVFGGQGCMGVMDQGVEVGKSAIRLNFPTNNSLDSLL